MPEHVPSSAGRTVVVAATILTMAGGFLLKAPCLGPWDDGREYNLLCYSDVAALYASDDRDRGLDEDRVPYIDGQNEYPVLTGLTMWVAAAPATSYPSFFVWTAVLLTAAAAATAWALHGIAGRRAMMFAVAPTLLIYGLVNWDLVAVVLATVATLAYLRDRDGPAGVLLGLGAAAKLYPALLVIPFALGRLRQGRGRDARTLAGGAALTWIAVNLPFALFGFDHWSEFFRFNSARGADWDSLWFIVTRPFGFIWDVGVLNLLSGAAFVAVSIVLWRAAAGRPGFRAWTFGFPLLVAFLITNKVYSPQYGLWLLPWFAAALPSLRLFVAFELADVAVFVTRFQFFARLTGQGPGLPIWGFELAVLVRMAVLIACLVAWVRAQSRVPAAASALEAA
ncbi:MAG: glycosyltransferase family 87 protein [Actinomycetota bacterium]